jgi:glycosyltransferase involved in cell wall biosynthesis
VDTKPRDELQVDGGGDAGLPLVTVVTPCLNQARFLEEAVRSVLEQDYPRIEHIVVDGGSTDGSVEILRRYDHVRWISEQDKGQSDALRKGFALARGEIYGWLNADDMYLPGAVSAAVARLKSGVYGLVYGGYRVVHENGEAAFEIPAHPFDFEMLLDAKNFVPQPSAFFTREAYEAVSGVDARYHYAMDYDLWVRIGRRFQVGVIDGMLSCFRFQSESKSVTAADRFYPEMRKISRRNGGRFFSRMYLDRLPQRRPALFKLVLVYRLLRRGDLRALARRERA